MTANKFLYLKEGGTDGTLYAEDGGVAIIWHNEEYLVGQCYRERLGAENLKVSLAHAFEEMINNSSNSAMFDFEGDDTILPLHIEEMASWLVADREGDFFENLIIFDFADYTEKTLGIELEKVAQKFFDNEHFRNANEE